MVYSIAKRPILTGIQGEIALVNDPQQIAEVELRQAFSRHLPRRVASLQRRLHALQDGGWDINLLRVYQLEAGQLAGTAGRYDMLEASGQLATLEQVLRRCTEAGVVPDKAQTEALLSQVGHLNNVSGSDFSDAPLVRSHEVAKPSLPPPAIERNGLPAATNVTTFIEPPLAFLPFDEAPTPLQQDSDDGPAEIVEPSTDRDFDLLVESSATIEVGDIAGQIVTGNGLFELETPDDPSASWQQEVKRLTGQQEAVTTEDNKPASRIADDGQAELTVADADNRLIYFLSDHRPVVLIDELASNYEVEFFDSLPDFIEVLNALSPDALLVSGNQFDELAQLTPLVQKARRHKQGKPMPFFVLGQSDLIEQRLVALRAGADAFLPEQTSASEIRRRLDELLMLGAEKPFRVLVIEDDQSQSMLTNRILRKAGMVVELQSDPLQIMSSLEAFVPDLILMDLYMPGCDGMELTTIIREHPRFLHTPIVFLSGESDTDKHFDALQAGGDDFLAKPVRPKHLISAVTNRVRRTRALAARQQRTASRQDRTTGLYDRRYLMDQINLALVSDEASPVDAAGGLLYVEIDDSLAIKRQHGTTGLDSISRQIGSVLSQHVNPKDVASRYADGTFALLLHRRSLAELRDTATDIIERVAASTLGVGDDVIAATVSVGICPLSNQFADAGSLVAAAERIAAEGAPAPGRLGLHEQMKSLMVSDLEIAIARSLSNAIKQNQLQVVYQPIVSLHGEEAELYQSLARLPMPDGDSLPASEFIDIAESKGAIAHIDRQMIARAVAVLDRRHRSGRETRLFVNQSAIFQRDNQRAKWLEQLLKLRHVEPSFLIMEFTLPSLIANPEALDQVQELRELGLGLSLAAADGNREQMTLIESLAPNYVKLLPLSSSSDPTDIKRLVERLHALELSVIMPIVEDARTAASLWSYEVDFIQGNFVQQPEPNLGYQFAGGN